MSPAAKRAYNLGLRAELADDRRKRIADETLRLFMERSYEDLTLQAVADAAGVSLKTVVRQFGTKDELIVACARTFEARESARRAATPGDVAGAAAALAERYEQMMDMNLRLVVLEDRSVAVATILKMARQHHLGWLGEMFAPWLPARQSRERTRRLAQLFAATENYVWHSWRRRLGINRKDAEAAMTGTLEALVAQWEREGGER